MHLLRPRLTKRLLLIGAIAAATALAALVASTQMALSAPRGALGGEADAGEVALWHEFAAAPSSTAMTQIVAAFNRAPTTTTIKERPIGGTDYFTLIRTSLASNKVPDVLQYEGNQQTRDFAKAGQLLDITAFWKQRKNRFHFAGAGEASCSYQGRIYCIPFALNTSSQIYYNTSILKKNGIAPPRTWEAFVAALAKLKANGVTPLPLAGKDKWPASHWYNLLLVNRCGVDRVIAAEKQQNGVKFTDPCFVRAAEDLESLGAYLAPGFASADYGTAVALFKSGKTAFFQMGDWFVGDYVAAPPKFKVGIMGFPAPSGRARGIVGGVPTVYAIPKKAKNQAGALEVLDWLTTRPPGVIWARTAGQMAMQKGAVEAGAPPQIKVIWKKIGQVKKVLTWTDLDTPPAVGEDAIYNGAIAVLTGKMTPEAFSASIQKAVRASAK